MSREIEEADRDHDQQQYPQLENGRAHGGQEDGGHAGGAVLEDAELARLLPKLSRQGYYTEPPLQQVRPWRARAAWLGGTGLHPGATGGACVPVWSLDAVWEGLRVRLLPLALRFLRACEAWASCPVGG